MKPFIGLKKLWYGEPLKAAPESITGLNVSGMTEVKNVHSGTFQYSQDDPTTNELKNELTGDTYYLDLESYGGKRISFTIGEYDFETRVALQGGKVTKGVWEAPKELKLIQKCIVAQTKTGHYICFPNAYITAKSDTQDKNIGLGIVALAVEDTTNGLADEYWLDGDYSE